ncbi:MAG: hypothetical protein EXS29_02450 [Pedosphaera sp.]|nr:hypothetical protein [Pedosphaera sp.]MST00158.1 hypothetical protein [Pedosphaera sp.]
MKHTLFPFAIAILLTGTISFAKDNPSAERIHEHIRELRLKASELKSAGKLDEAERLFQESERLMKKAGGLQPVADKKPGAAANKREQWLAERAQKVQALRAEGKKEEAEKLIFETKELLHKKQGQKPGETPQIGGKGDDARRKHLSEAIAHLREAGMADLADKLQQQFAVHGKSAEAHQKPQDNPPKIVKGQAPDAGQKPVKPHGDLHPKAAANDDAHALRAELGELRKAVRELQQINRERAPRKE